MARARIGIIVGTRGRGSNMVALHEASLRGEPFTIAVVLAPSENAPAVAEARTRGLRVEIVPPGDNEGSRMVAALGDVDYVCLAGFLRLLPSEVLHAFPDRVLNIHPALLPKFGGKGMYGLHVHQAVLGAGETESGCTVHRVTERYDEGDILLQLRCPVMPDDTPETLAARVLALEHQAYAAALRGLVERTGS